MLFPPMTKLGKLWLKFLHGSAMLTPQELEGNDEWLEHLEKKCEEDIKGVALAEEPKKN